MAQQLDDIEAGRRRVFFIDGRRVYHFYDNCRAISNNLSPLMNEEQKYAESMGLEPCRNCNNRPLGFRPKSKRDS